MPPGLYQSISMSMTIRLSISITVSINDNIHYHIDNSLIEFIDIAIDLDYKYRYQKQISALLHGGPANFEDFRRVQETTPSIYSEDLSVYTDEVNERHDRNMAEWRQLLTLLK